MGLFRRKVALFILPLLIVISIAFGKYLYAGVITYELLPFDISIAAQRIKTDKLLGMGYNEQTPYYKLRNANIDRVPVLALGTSRVMQFSSVYFYDGMFYNTGGAVRNNFDEYINFLENLNYTPKVIILGIDFWLFNEKFIGNYPECPCYATITQVERSFNAILKEIIQDAQKEKWTLPQLNNYASEIGLNGRIKQSGFRRDGTYYYGDVYRAPENADDYQFKDTLKRIDEGSRRFEYGSDVYDKTVDELDQFLSYCMEREIKVVGFLPPVAPTVYNAMISSGNYGYVEKIPDICKKAFDEYGYYFEDLLNMSLFGIEDDYYIDGFHGSEIVYAIITKELVLHNQTLQQYVNYEALLDKLNNRYNNLVFDNLWEN